MVISLSRNLQKTMQLVMRSKTKYMPELIATDREIVQV